MIDKLWGVTCIFNPIPSKQRVANFRLFRDRLANHRRRFTIPTILDLIAQAGVFRAGGHERSAREVVDQLATDMLQAALNAHSRPLRIPAELIPRVKTPPLPPLVNFFLLIHRSTRTAWRVGRPGDV